MKNTIFSTSLLALGLAFGDTADMHRGDFTVTFKDCPKCTMRARFAPDGKTATVNTSKVAEADRPAMAERAFRLMERAADAKKPSARRPLLGWSSWNTFGLDISDTLILDTAKAMATNGLKAAGYLYVNIDDGFFEGHDEKGMLKWNLKRFPNGMKPVVDGIHDLGLKAGTYSDAGADMCGGHPGSGLYGHDAADCQLHFNELGFDFIKVDYCGGTKLGLDERRRYTEISRAIRKTGRPVRFNMCRWAFPGTWAADIAESWRTTGDIRANWGSVKELIADNLYLSAYAKLGHYNDMDMLQVGRYVGQVRNAYVKTDTGLTLEEEATHFGIWCMLSSPLLIGCDVRNIPATTLALVTNPYLLAMNQNDLGVQAYVADRRGETYVLVKDADKRFGRARFVAFYNATDGQQDFKLDFATVDLGGRVEILELGERADLGVFEGAFAATVPPHGARFYRLDAQKRLDRAMYEAETAYLSDYQELRPACKEGSAFYERVNNASGGIVVRNLGGKPSNDLVWKNVKLSTERDMVLAYSATTNHTLFVEIDLGNSRKYELKPTGKGFATQNLGRLAPGTHTIRLFNASDALPDIDYLKLVR